MDAELTTLCYIEHDGRVLMLHRTRKDHDINKGKWIGVGGHFLDRESPDECLRREVLEETGMQLGSWSSRGIVTFDSGDGCFEYMHLFTGTVSDEDATQGEAAPEDWPDGLPEGWLAGPACDEGVLAWVPKEDIPGLELWEGDRIFLKLLAEDKSGFFLKLIYDGTGKLLRAVLDGEDLGLT